MNTIPFVVELDVCEIVNFNSFGALLLKPTINIEDEKLEMAKI